MENTRYLIIGGGAAGTTAAETIRTHDPEGRIVIVSDEPHCFYSRIMLSKPNFFLEKIPFEQIWLKTESWYAERKIDLVLGKKAVRLDASLKKVFLDDGATLSYEKLLLAVGGYARRWTIPGSEKQGIFYLRTLDDAKAIIAAVKETRRAVAIGGGFISFEMCEMMRLAGLEVSLILRESHYWEPLLDGASGRIIEKALENGSVQIFRNAEVEEVKGENVVTNVVLKDGKEIPCEMIIVGIGVFCPFEWIRDGGVAVNRGILTNEYLETSIPDVWAAGDSAEFNDLILGERIQLGNWVNAQMQGRAAGINMAGKKEPFRLVSFYTTQGFDTAIAFVGDVRPEPSRLIITRGSGESGKYGRILTENGEIVGATLINRTADLAPLSRLIEKDVEITGRETELADPNFDLARLVS